MIGAAVQDLTTAKWMAGCVQARMPQGRVHAHAAMPDTAVAVRAAAAEGLTCDVLARVSGDGQHNEAQEAAAQAPLAADLR